MDEVIFEEFKGTGNSEAILDENFREKNISAIDITKSGTEEELIFEKNDLPKNECFKKNNSPNGFYGCNRIYKF